VCHYISWAASVVVTFGPNAICRQVSAVLNEFYPSGCPKWSLEKYHTLTLWPACNDPIREPNSLELVWPLLGAGMGSKRAQRDSTHLPKWTWCVKLGHSNVSTKYHSDGTSGQHKSFLPQHRKRKRVWQQKKEILNFIGTIYRISHTNHKISLPKNLGEVVWPLCLVCLFAIWSVSHLVITCMPVGPNCVK